MCHTNTIPYQQCHRIWDAPTPSLVQLKANFTGTEYMLWGQGFNRSVNKGFGVEQLCINFKQNAIRSAGGPRTMFTTMPLPEAQWQPSASDGSDSLSVCLEQARRKELPQKLERKMAMLCTKPPEYDENVKGGQKLRQECVG